MSSIKTIIKYELIRYFYSPLAYIYLIGFLLLSGSCAVYFGHFFANGQANLWALFDYQPWIYLLFIPGIAMRSWAEEFRSKSIVQILTIPVSITSLVWGKFFASWIFAAIAIILTFPFWITVNLLGTPDNTVIFISYLGCFILAGTMLAISQTMSSLTKNPVIAMVLAVFANLLFFWSGFEYVLFWARELFSDVIVDTIISFSFLTHFISLSRGLVELRDLVFFGSLIIFFNLATIAIISLKTKGTSGLVSSSNFKHGIAVLLLLFIGFFGLNIIANNILRQFSYDFTEEKYLSLTKNTKDILRKLERPVVAKLYYSPILGQRNPAIRQIFEQLKLMLKQYKSYSRGKFDYRIYMPKFLDKDEDRAIADGIQPIPLIDINQNALFGISFSDTLTNTAVIPFFSLERLPFLEQDLTTNIYKLHHKKKRLGLMSSLPVLGDAVMDGVMLHKWQIMKHIGELYDIQLIKKKEDLDQTFDAFMLIHPKDLDEDVIEKLKKQQKVLLLLDVADEARRLYSPQNGSFLSSDLGALADYWGIEFFGDKVAADFDNSITVDDTINYQKNPSFTQDLLQFRTTEADFNINHRITYKLHNILFSSASMVTLRNGANVLYFPLIKTSFNSSLIDAKFAKNSVAPSTILTQYTPSNNMTILAAEFLSNDEKKPFDIIAVGDTDFIYDAFWAREEKFLDNSYFVPIFDSANFILNALDYLTENDDLIGLRGKSIKRRQFFKVDNMRKADVYRFKLKENDIFQAINGAKQTLREVVAKKNFEERQTFSADELAVIGNVRSEIDTLRQQLSELQQNAHKDIQNLEVSIKFFNIYAISLLIFIAASLVYLRKHNILFLSGNFKEIFDKRLLRLVGAVAVILAAAYLSVYFEHRNSISEYEDKLVFRELDKRLNDIESVTLTSSSQSLMFQKQNGVWQLFGFEDLPVYQERIRRFLITLAQMTYYEKKSDQVDDMKYFGFSSLQDKTSPMITVTLKDKSGKIIEKFDIGWYDIDLGRGGKGAFIRLNNLFQVWKVNADFYDLSLNKDEWTYSTLWNLRFGRLARYNDVEDEKKIMELAKLMLNIHFLGINDNIQALQEANLEIWSENNNYLNLVFYKNSEDKYFVQYNFLRTPQGKHLELFAKYVKGKYLEISKDAWKRIKDDTNRAK